MNMWHDVVDLDEIPCFFKLGLEKPRKAGKHQHVFNQPEGDAENGRRQFYENREDPDEANRRQYENLFLKQRKKS